PETGDGAGILIQVPDAFYREVVGFALPEPGTYAVGTAFLPHEGEVDVRAEVERIAAEEGATVLGWRDLPVDTDHVGPTARTTMPAFSQ
ncbi:hypothetical protein K7G98_40395, partial [Saccharothrix sp. MB29]|nr:hypothetical protein [Saccharothrix sp. MB29]